MKKQLIAIEGIDGSGKGTQAALLRERLRSDGYTTNLISFPRYSETFFGARVGDFLNGRFGSLLDVDPFLASLLYAGDRLESKQLLLDSIENNDYTILDRYVASSLAHQCVKATNPNTLISWVESVEYGIHGLPKADWTILLDMPADAAQTLIQKKGKRNYTDMAADIQESDRQYLAKVREAYLVLAQSATWIKIPTTTDMGEIKSVDAVSREIMSRAIW